MKKTIRKILSVIVLTITGISAIGALFVDNLAGNGQQMTFAGRLALFLVWSAIFASVLYLEIKARAKDKHQ